jgi:hypothetical protein
MNLVGVVLPGDRVAAMPRNVVRYRNGLCEKEEEITTPLAEPPTQVAAPPAGLF